MLSFSINATPLRLASVDSVPILLITIDPVCVWCYVLNNTTIADVLTARSLRTGPLARLFCMWACVLSVAGVCLCLHQLRVREEAEGEARSFTVVPKHYRYCCGDREEITATMGHLSFSSHAHTLIQTATCGDPQAPASYHPHTYPGCLDTK